MITTDFQEIVDAVMAQSNERRKETVRALVDLLHGMARRGVKVFTIANVGRECEQAGILKTQTIRNVNGEPFRRIIEAFAAANGLATTHVPARRVTPLEEAIEAIPDLDARVRLRALIDDNRALVAQVRRLETGFKRLQEPNVNTIAPTATITPAAAAPEVEVIPPEPQPKINFGPLERFIGTDWIDSRAWTVNQNGTIMDGDRAITPPGFVPALCAVIQLLTGRC